MAQMYNTQMAMSMAGAFGGGQAPAMPVMPTPAPTPTPTSPPMGGMSPATNPMMSPVTANPFGPAVVGYQQLPDGTVVPVYAQGGM